MSSIYFHTIGETVGVRGSERAHFGVFCDDLAWGILRREADGANPPLKRVFPPDHHIHLSRDFERDARVSFFYGMEKGFILSDREINPFSLSLNTAGVLGSDAVKLAARIHGQCEIHAWVDGSNRNWLAGIIEQGVKSGFYRSGQGWDKVIELLKEDSENAVVLSYSVCEGFPNGDIAGWTPPVNEDGDPDYDAWYELSEEEQWSLAFAGLASSGGGLELSPDNWDEFFFSDGYTALNLVRDLGE